MFCFILFYFDIFANTLFFGGLLSGRVIHLLEKDYCLDGQFLSNYICSHDIDCIKITPRHLEELGGNVPIDDLLPKELLILGGESASPDLLESLTLSSKKISIMNHYGPTESTVGVLTYGLAESIDNSHIAKLPIGKSLPNISTYLLDQDLRPIGQIQNLEQN